MQRLLRMHAAKLQCMYQLQKPTQKETMPGKGVHRIQRSLFARCARHPRRHRWPWTLCCPSPQQTLT